MAVRTCRIALAAVFLLPALIGSANADGAAGSDFWLAFPANFGGPELTLFIVGNTATSGTVEVPGIEFSQGFDVTPGQVTSVSIPSDAQITADDSVSNLGIHVTAADPVTVYGLNRIAQTTDGYLGLPVSAVGTDYLALAYSGGNSEFAVVGTQDNTTVTITPSVDLGARAAGQSFQVPLDEGQTYELTGSDVSGTSITSDKPISVFAGAQCASIPPDAFACDHIVEQLPPTSEWGKRFLTIPLATRNGDTFRILASQDDTTVQINGQAIPNTLARGQFYETVLTDPSQIVADKPVLVMQYANSSSVDGATGDPFQMTVAPYEQFLAAYTVATPATDFTNYVNVVAPSDETASVTLDGSLIPASAFTPIGSSGFSGAQLPVAGGMHTLSAPRPFGVSVYGWASFESYGYPGDLGVGAVANVATLKESPDSGTAQVGAQQCVTATVADGQGAPSSDIRVDFAVSGANSRAGFAVTDSSGTAQFCYSADQPGSDTVTATVGTISDTATRTWTAPPQPVPPPPPPAPPPPPPPPRTDVSLAVGGPAYARVGEQVAFTETVSNSGPDTATGVELSASVPAGATFVSATLSNGNACRSGGGTVTCFVGTLGAGASVTATLVVTSQQTGQLTQTAVVQADYDANGANNSGSATTAIIAADAPPPPPPPPSQPGTFNAISTGTVMVNGQPLPPDTMTLIGSGATIDVTNGLVTLTDFDQGSGTFSNVQLNPRRRTAAAGSRAAAGSVPAAFTIRQPAKPGAAVTLTLTGGNFALCGKGRRLAAKNQTAVRQLWGHAKGQFTTKGSYSAATIRGTTWLTQDRCDGTLTKAVDDVVTVADFVKHTTVTLQPGQSYLAVPKAKPAKRRTGKK